MAIGPIEHEANPKLPVMESGHRSEAGNVLTHPATIVSEEPEGEKLISLSSSSSSSSSSGDLDGNETSKSKPTPGDIASPAEQENQNFPVSSMPLHDLEHKITVPSNNRTTLESENEPEAPTQSPPIQFMERPAADQTTPPAYRIPSRVFNRDKSSAPMDWSVASNESLFSIHMGTMSFTKEQFPWLGKSGELGLSGENSMMSSPLPNAMFSGPLFELQSHQQPINQQPQIVEPAENGLKISHATVNERFGVTESMAAETLREVIKENEEELDKEKANARGSIPAADSASLSHLNSDASGGRIKSFAFPVLPGDDKNGSISLKGHHTSPQQSSQPPSSKAVHLQHRHPYQDQPRPETSKQAATPRVTPANPFVPSRWLSCFSCCRFCC